MTAIEFILNAIAYQKKLNREKGKDYKGIHVVFSGLNEALRAYFKTDAMTADEVKALPMKLVDEAIATGKIVKAFSKGGPSLYLAGEAPERAERITTKADALAKFGMAPPPVIAPKQTVKRK